MWLNIFPENLKRLRKERHLTQQQLAKEIGISRSAISMYEKGDREPNFETAEKFADFFNVSLNTLISQGLIDEYIAELRKRQLKLTLFRDANAPDSLLDDALRYALYIHDLWLEKEKNEAKNDKHKESANE